MLLSLRSAALVGGKYLSKTVCRKCSQVSFKLTGSACNHCLAPSRRENGNSCILIASGVTPLCLSVLQYSKKFLMCSWGSSIGEPENCLCCTMVIYAGATTALLLWRRRTVSYAPRCPMPWRHADLQGARYQIIARDYLIPPGLIPSLGRSLRPCNLSYKFFALQF